MSELDVLRRLGDQIVPPPFEALRETARRRARRTRVASIAVAASVVAAAATGVYLARDADRRSEPAPVTPPTSRQLTYADGSTIHYGDRTVEAFADDLLRFAHDAVDELGAGRDVVDEALHHARRPDAVVLVALLEHHASARAGDEMRNVVDRCAAFLLDRHDLLTDRVLGDARRIVQRAEDEVGRALVVGDDLFLHLLMDRALDRAHEARAHVDAVRAERQRRHQPARIAEAARGDHRDLDLIGRNRNEDQPWDVVLARMPGALEAVDRDRIHTHALG